MDSVASKSIQIQRGLISLFHNDITNFLKGTLSKTCLKKKKERIFRAYNLMRNRSAKIVEKVFYRREVKRRQNLKVKKIHEKKGKVIQSRTCGGFI